MQVLIVGGAGYIGSHMVHTLIRSGYEAIVLDDLSGGHADAVIGAKLFVGCCSDKALLEQLFKDHDFCAVMHFASFIQVGESSIDPAKYYANNFCKTANLLNTMISAGVSNFVFSSTAAVYGNPISAIIQEDHPKHPINPYGRSKWMVEQLLEDYDTAYQFRSVSLRYFNASGCAPDTGLGERHDPETHLIPLVLQTASGRKKAISIFGDDYETPDGTCVRDYIHVLDICSAHLLAMQYLLDGGKSDQFNLGNGSGFSVKQVINSARELTGREIPVVTLARRLGDPARLVADASKASQILRWQPGRSDLNTIISDAWSWEVDHCW
ncbi:MULTISPECIES: UDP-glucose 4-epimerase GalE [unclassified Pseudomonas]|uniref:UDP-glucose 4-epimerase GalE n=1 Tax=unclassified Pseudomonas TaxID=196821 RepID=UPI001780B58D|nr:UDP-glucose 4-epimerase GalE [Pseudomonas sp. CFBP 8772]MBD8599175.1 UDP-glucose 4-epimerase GalE [Pseudomonas sp. CFBP 8772]